MAARNLQCRECETTYPLDARYVCERCFGPLEVAYSHGRLAEDVPGLRRRIQGGPQNIWRYADFLPLEGPQPRDVRTGLPAGCTPLIRADRLAAAARPARGLGQERRRQPDALLQGPRRVGRGRRARELGFDVARLRLDRQPGQLRRRPRRGARDGVLRLHPGRPRGAEDPRHGRLRHEPGRGATATTTTSTASAPSSPASATGRSSTSTCARTTPRAPRRWPSRSPSSSAGSCPTASSSPIASGSLFTKIAKGFEEFRRARPRSRATRPS